MNQHAKSYPWRKLYVSDYLSDQRILLVSLAARGLLADIEALAYTGEEPGRLILSGRAMTAAEIGRLRGCEVATVEASLQELLQVGLLERDQSGIIISPALLPELKERDQVRRRVQRHRDRQGNVTPNVTPSVTLPVTGQSQSQSQNRVRTEPKKNNTSAASPTGFAEFWARYPRKVGKGAAEKAWKKLPESTGVLPLILAALQWQIQSRDWQRDGGQFIPFPASYLNQRRWEDQPLTPATTGDDHARVF